MTRMKCETTVKMTWVKCETTVKMTQVKCETAVKMTRAKCETVVNMTSVRPQSTDVYCKNEATVKQTAENSINFRDCTKPVVCV